MARIKIKDLPRNMKVSKEEMKKIRGGYVFTKTALSNATNTTVISTDPSYVPIGPVVSGSNISAPEHDLA